MVCKVTQKREDDQILWYLFSFSVQNERK